MRRSFVEKSMLPGNAKCSMTSLADTKHIFTDLWRIEFCIWLRRRVVHVINARFVRDEIINSLHSGPSAARLARKMPN